MFGYRASSLAAPLSLRGLNILYVSRKIYHCILFVFYETIKWIFRTYFQNYRVIFSLRLFQFNIVYFLDIDSENVERSAKMDSRLLYVSAQTSNKYIDYNCTYHDSLQIDPFCVLFLCITNVKIKGLNKYFRRILG